jgi:hypothetical protein
MKKLQILMIVLAIALTFPTLVLAAPPSAPSQEESCWWISAPHNDCLVNLGCIPSFRATYEAREKLCCENQVCHSFWVRTFQHCRCS